MTISEAARNTGNTPQEKAANFKGMTAFGSYYSKKHSMCLMGRVEGSKGNRARFFPFNENIEAILVPVRMFDTLISVSDNGTKVVVIADSKQVITA